MLINKKTKILFSFLLIFSYSLSIVTLVLIDSPTIFFTITFTLTFILALWYLNFLVKRKSDFEIKEEGLLNKFYIKLIEIVATVMIIVLLVNTYVVYSFWTLINNLVSTKHIPIIVILLTLISGLLIERKIICFLIVFVVIQPVILNTQINSPQLLSGFVGTFWLVYYTKESAFESQAISNYTSRILLLSLAVTIILFLFFPFATDSIVQNPLGISNLNLMLNMIPIILFLTCLLFSIDFKWLIIGFFVIQMILFFVLGFNIQGNKHTEIDFILFNSNFIENIGAEIWLTNLLKILIDFIFALLFFGLLNFISEIFSFFSDKNSFTKNISYLNEKRFINATICHVVNNLSLMGNSLKDVPIKDEDPKIMRSEMLLNFTQPLLLTNNPFSFFNLSITALISKLNDSNPIIEIMNLLKFNWLVHLYSIILILLIIIGKKADFLFWNSKLPKYSKKAKIEVV
ncbi:hypothetical protein [Spiroplasma alleghenense]|uniref:Transmembrane protein n=1 Tax=Spiroplasma alleghenense TaxID=216931 RepID=A0A345Z505_9MOLU|nr:hypothetical protein [Spiroplasma alleghenense]AXK51684.1 hypothetical protein SALLE_v1c10140 [Spiroplasma alleghenense]